jgi:hypothetical protein
VPRPEPWYTQAHGGDNKEGKEGKTYSPALGISPYKVARTTRSYNWGIMMSSEDMLRSVPGSGKRGRRERNEMAA